MKISLVQQALKHKKISALVLFHSRELQDSTVQWLSQRKTESSVLVLTPTKLTHYVLGFDYARYAREPSVKTSKHIWRQLHYTGRVAVNEQCCTLAQAKRLGNKAEVVPFSAILNRLRSQKTRVELQHIRKACMITDSIFNVLLKMMYALPSELAVAQFIEQQAKEQGCTLAFPPVIASGSNAQHPHHEPTTTLEPGFCIIDFGVVYKGYMSDMTRTLFLGEPRINDKRKYNKVLRAQQKALAMVRPGVAMKTITREVKKMLGNAFIHGIGHGIGVEIHEPAKTLRENMVITIEPGVYDNGQGIRIEDTVLVTNKGCEVLTKSDKSFLVT